MHYINKAYGAGRDDGRTFGSLQNGLRNADLDNNFI